LPCVKTFTVTFVFEAGTQLRFEVGIQLRFEAGTQLRFEAGTQLRFEAILKNKFDSVTTPVRFNVLFKKSFKFKNS